MDHVSAKAGQTILQLPQNGVEIGEATYTVAPPSVGTLIRASMEIAKLPAFKLNSEDIVTSVMGVAKDCSVLGDIIAIFILGVKGLEEKVMVEVVEEKRYLFGLVKRYKKSYEERTIDRKAELSQRVLEEVSPRELNNLIARLLAMLQISDFFAATTFLIEANLLRETREVVSGTTAFGQ